MSDSLLAIDPSSSCAGLAYFPSLARDQAPTFLHVVRPSASWEAIKRIDHIVAGVLDVVRKLRPSTVMMEYSSGRVAGNMQGKGISGLAVLGQCQGEVRRALLDMDNWPDTDPRHMRVETVTEKWTNRVPKPKRAMMIRAAFPVYREFADTVGDPGMDAADAVGIGIYYIGQRNPREVVERAR